MEFCKRLDQRDLLRAGETPRLQPVDLLALLTDLTGDAGAFFVALKLPLAGLRRSGWLLASALSRIDPGLLSESDPPDR
jgi:hypothetical protein